MSTFDHTKYYYRPVDRGDGYASCDDEIINDAEGYIEAGSVIIEFSSLQDAGKWVYLGKEIKVLSIPEDAIVEKNIPMGQGGCYEYSANKAIVVETIDVFEYLRRVKNEVAGRIEVHNLDFPSGYEFPEHVYDCIFEECSFKSSPGFTEKLRRLSLRKCIIQGVFKLPQKLDELVIIGKNELFYANANFVFPRTIEESLALYSVALKTPLDMSQYSCASFHFDNCQFERPVILPKTPDIKNKKTNHIHIVFDKCRGIDKNLVIPDGFTGNIGFTIINTAIDDDLLYQLKNKCNCQVTVRDYRIN